jgi:hypothetical protein
LDAAEESLSHEMDTLESAEKKDEKGCRKYEADTVDYYNCKGKDIKDVVREKIDEGSWPFLKSLGKNKYKTVSSRLDIF